MALYAESVSIGGVTAADVDTATEADTLLDSVQAFDVSYLSICYSDSKFGATIYYTASGRIQVVEPIEDNELNNVMALVVECSPQHIILSSKSEAKLLDMLKFFAEQSMDSKGKPMDLTQQDSADTPRVDTSGQESGCSESVDSDLGWKLSSPYHLHVVSHTLFAYENCKNRILSLDFKNRSFADTNEKFLYISSLINFSDNITFRSFGALLRFLDNNLIDIRSESGATTVEVSSIARHYIPLLMSIERNTYESLQIFQNEWHPSAAKQGINKKEGLSLYGLLNCCVSKVGASYLRKMLLLPTQEYDILLDRLNTIEFFGNARNIPLRNSLLQHVKHITGVTALFNRLGSDNFSVNDMHTIHTILVNALKIRDLVNQHKSVALNVFQQISSHFDREVDDLAHIICKVIDFNKSIKSQLFEVNPGVDEELDKTKYVFSRLPEMLEEVAKKELQDHPSLEQCTCMYLPQIGFMTSVQIGPNQQLPHEVDPGLRFVVQLADRAYYRTLATQQLDTMFGDIQSDITDRQVQIVTFLKDKIWRHKELFIEIVKCSAKLDALLAMSRTAVQYGYVRPHIATDGNIEIVGGKHPLIELMCKAVVDNDYRSGGQHLKTKLISGPNACGKSVYLKQICLIVYMAHIGCYVPAVAAKIPIIDGMFTRIQSPESISMRLSTFMLDLKQISYATRNATPRSLVVIDEFGKGTQHIDGLALMASSLNYLMHPNRCPHLVVSSHFKALPSLVDRKQEFECQTFELIRKDNQIDYLYKLTAGHSEDSIASHIAYLTDIPDDVIQRGKQICESIANNKPIDCFDVSPMNGKYDSYEEMAIDFLRLELASEEDDDIYRFFRTNFAQNFRSDSSEE